jgi:type IV pilus assembly protein PilV
MSHPVDYRPCQTGYTLLEVLVAFFVLSIGLLGLATLQGVTLQGNNKSFHRSIAMVQAYDMADRMRANMAGINAGAYNSLPVSGSVDDSCLATGCTPAQLAVIDGDQWTEEIARVLPSGEGAVTVLAVATTITAPIFQIDVGWQEIGTSLQHTLSSGEKVSEQCDDTLDATGLTCFRLEFSP